MILVTLSKLDRWAPLWSIYIIQIPYIVRIMYVFQEPNHVILKLFKSFFIGLEVYVTIDLVS